MSSFVTFQKKLKTLLLLLPREPEILSDSSRKVFGCVWWCAHAINLKLIFLLALFVGFCLLFYRQILFFIALTLSGKAVIVDATQRSNGKALSGTVRSNNSKRRKPICRPPTLKIINFMSRNLFKKNRRQDLSDNSGWDEDLRVLIVSSLPFISRTRQERK